MKFFVKTLKGEKGPYHLAQLQELVTRGILTERHFLRSENSSEFVLASTVSKLFGQSEKTSEPRAGAKSIWTSTESSIETPPDILPDSSWEQPVYRPPSRNQDSSEENSPKSE